MQTLTYELTFLSPAFLGNAEQSAQWRTPPIKALLRQCWRVAFAANVRGRIDVQAMRHAEGLLFGHAWLDDDRNGRGGKVAARRSKIRIRLDAWSSGTLPAAQWKALAGVHHREVGRQVSADLYLGYGPVGPPGGAPASVLKSRAAIQAGEHARLSLALPGEDAPRLQQALDLMHAYGTLGGRSRNGWGSVRLAPQSGTPSLSFAAVGACTCRWQDALGHDWSQAIGTDSRGPLVWATSPLPSWREAMVQLARLKIALRTQFRFPHRESDGQIHDRHWLSYPITNHKVQDWERTGLRLPNSLRFKLRADADGRLRGVIFHMPCLPPPAFRPDPRAIERVWQQVHAHLDADATLARIPA